MDVWKTRSRRALSPGRLYRALPAVLMGTVLNTLDAVSTGLLVFPSADGGGTAFQGLQVQAMSMYLMSTIASQLAMTLGGSLFPGALGSMLIEILPFLRGIATSIRITLGDNNPAILPTVMAAYALTSFLIGAVFLVLGTLNCGKLVAYFPRTVLTGVIGSIGVSLFILGLELTFPPGSETMTLSNAGRILFSRLHFPLFAASFLPALFLSVSVRSSFLERITHGGTQHALYVPVYVLGVAGLFWIVAAATGGGSHTGMEELARQGWLFTVEAEVEHQSGIGTAWIYWRLFDFSKTEWKAMKSAITDIVLLVVIGVFNLPVYVPAMALALDVPSYNMNHEFLGHGASNILAGVLGTVPNLVVFSNSVFFTRAGGGRFEAILTTILTFVLFLVSGLLLPYVPTILASALVLFLGFELMIEALWESAKTLLWSEWFVVLGTLLACTFVGFAPGFGIGVAIAMVAYMGWGVLDSRARTVELSELEGHHELAPSQRGPFSRGLHISPAVEPLGNNSNDLESSSSEKDAPSVASRTPTNVRVVTLSGYAFFATIPSLEDQMKSKFATHIIIDLTHVHRMETTVAEFIGSKTRELAAKPKPTAVVLCGVKPGSGVAADLVRGGFELRWPGMEEGKRCVRVWEHVGGALEWCKSMPAVDLASSSLTILSSDPVVSISDAAVMESFCELFVDSTILLRMENRLSVGRYESGNAVLSKETPADRIIFIVQGTLAAQNAGPEVTLSDSKWRISIRSTILNTAALLPRLLRLRAPSALKGSEKTLETLREDVLFQRGDVVGLEDVLREAGQGVCTHDVVASTASWTVELRREVGRSEDEWRAACDWAARVVYALGGSKSP